MVFTQDLVKYPQVVLGRGKQFWFKLSILITGFHPEFAIPQAIILDHFIYMYIPSYICAYCGNPASFNHLHASTASISTKSKLMLTFLKTQKVHNTFFILTMKLFICLPWYKIHVLLKTELNTGIKFLFIFIRHLGNCQVHLLIYLSAAHQIKCGLE